MEISNVAEDHRADLSQFNQRCSCRKQDGTWWVNMKPEDPAHLANLIKAVERLLGWI